MIGIDPLTATACSSCGTPHGWVAPGKPVPQRLSGAAFGKPGFLFCRACYKRLKDKHCKARDRAARKNRTDGEPEGWAENLGEHPAVIASRQSTDGFRGRARTVLVENFAAMGAGLEIVGVKRFTVGDLTPRALSALARQDGGEAFRAVYRDGFGPGPERPWHYQVYQRRAHRASPRGRGVGISEG